MNAGYARIQLLLDQQRFEMAGRELEDLLARSPDEPLAHALLAHCLSEQKQAKRALVHARLAVGLAPDMAFCHYILAIVQQELNQLKEARRSIGMALALNPEDPDFHTRLGLISLLESRWNEALSCAEQGLSLDPEHIDSQNLRSMALVRLGQSAPALDQLEQALLKEPENARVHANRGWTLLQSGQHEAAMDAFGEALRLEPGLEWAREGLLEALKARHWLYRQFMRYAFWMARYGRKHQFLIMIGLILAMRLIIGLAGQASTLLAGGLVLIYAGFVAMTWLADPLFNLLLLFHPLGRYVLLPHERRGAIWIASLIGGSAVSLLAGLFSGQIWMLLGSLALLGLVLPTAGTFASSSPRTRQILGGYTLGLASLAGAGLVGLQLNHQLLFGASFGLFVIALIAYSWIANWLILRD